MRIADQDNRQWSAFRLLIAAGLTGVLATYLSTAMWLAPFLDNPGVGEGYKHSVSNWLSGVIRDARLAMYVGIPTTIFVTLVGAYIFLKRSEKQAL